MNMQYSRLVRPRERECKLGDIIMVFSCALDVNGSIYVISLKCIYLSDGLFPLSMKIADLDIRR